MVRKLIILYTANYCQKMKNVFEVEELVKHHEVEFWDLSEITAHEKLSCVHTEGLKELTIVSTFQFLRCVFKNVKYSPVYASVMGYSYFSYKVFIILSLFKSTFVTVTNGTLPFYPLVSDMDQNKSKKIFRLQNLSHRIANLLFKTSLIKPADYALISCEKAIMFYKTDEKTKRFDSSSGDYNDAINLLRKDNQVLDLTKYIVFLDQYSPFHNDYDLFGLTKIDADYYYYIMNAYFEKLEQYHKCEVIIAAHPSAEKYKEHNYFKGRKVVFNQTASLVMNSIGVLTLNSTAVSYVVVYKKPLIFISMPGFPDYDYGVMRLLATELNSKIVDISVSDDVTFDEVPIEAYEAYRLNYLSKIKSGISNADIFSKILNENS